MSEIDKLREELRQERSEVEQLKEIQAQVFASHDRWKARAEAAEARNVSAELDSLRLIVTEKFARDIEVAVKPEDAADVAKWAQNPDAVRHFIRLEPVCADHFDGRHCTGGASHHPECANFLAWAALDDPRAAEAIGAAFDRARPPPPYRGGFLRMRTPEERNGSMVVTRTVVNGGRFMAEVSGLLYPASWDVEPGMRVGVGPEGALVPYREPPADIVGPTGAGAAVRLIGSVAHAIADNLDAPFRLTSESEQAAQVRVSGIDTSEAMAASPLVSDEIILRHVAEARRISDARGMEAVEDEADDENNRRAYPDRAP